VAETAEFSQRRLREARQVLRHSLELAKAVRDHTITLEVALAKVKAEQEEMADAETLRGKKTVQNLNSFSLATSFPKLTGI
jgi:hypothetical protein